jgi:hypothetical protein
MLRLKIVVGALVAVASLVFTGGLASASYNGSNAADYADYWAMSSNIAYYGFSDDCTNFVSQAMVAGGMPAVRGLWTNGLTFYNDLIATYDSDPTYQSEDQREESISATVASYLEAYLDTSGAGSFVGSYSYAADGSAPSYMPASIVKGDVLFYDWGQGLGVSHASMMVGSGTDSDGYVGDWVDTHTNDHRDEFWTLKESNSYWEDTTVYYYHVIG